MLPETTATLLNDAAFLNIPRKNGEPIHIGNTTLVPKQAQTQQPVTQNNSGKLNREKMPKETFKANNNSTPSSTITKLKDANKLPTVKPRGLKPLLSPKKTLGCGRKNNVCLIQTHC
jgi:hypothetical protein